MKKWQLKNTGGKHKYLILLEGKIGHLYFNKGEKIEIDRMIANSIPPPKLEQLPFDYIREITSKVSSTQIKIKYKKDSELHYDFLSLEGKNTFLEEVAAQNAALTLATTELGIFQSIRVQLIALLVLSIYFGWCYHSAYAIENGTHLGRDFVIVLLLAGLGTKTLKWIILGVLAIVALKIYFTLRSREPLQSINFRGGQEK